MPPGGLPPGTAGRQRQVAGLPLRGSHDGSLDHQFRFTGDALVSGLRFSRGAMARFVPALLHAGASVWALLHARDVARFGLSGTVATLRLLADVSRARACAGSR
jgi:hypothetical protein